MQHLMKISARYFQTNSTKANVLYGKSISERILSECRNQCEDYFRRYQRRPKLVAIQVGNNESSKLYVRNKQRIAEHVDIDFQLINHHMHITPSNLLTTIDELNRDDTVNGILLQLPLPLHLIDKTDVFIERIRPDKDVDGHTKQNIYAYRNKSTPIVTVPVVGAVREILAEIGEPLRGKNVVVIGRSQYVGTPLALMLSQSSNSAEEPLISGATVTICHRETHPDNLTLFCKNADVIVSAVGRAKLVTPRMVRLGATIIDVGISKNKEFVGDVDFDEVKHLARWITPVPGGVGPVTVACLMRNLLRLAHQAKREK